MLSCRNPRSQPGTPGNLDASQGIPVLDVAQTRIDRSLGDIHPSGNPHYWLVPDNAHRVAAAIAARLGQLDPAGAPVYDADLTKFESELKTRRAAWERTAAPVRGVRVATCHKSWSYLCQWLGLVEVGSVEPKPGVTPPLSHVGDLVRRMRAQHAKMVLMESFYSRSTAQQVAQLAGARLVVLPSDVGARPDASDYFALVDAVVRQLAEAAK